MNPKLKALLVGGTLATVAGVTAYMFVPKASTTKVMLADAGIREDCNFKTLRCTVMVDGEYGTIKPDVAVCPTGTGKPEVIWPRGFLAIRDSILDEDTMCKVVGVPTNPNMDAQPVLGELPCACHNPLKGPCADDAGMVAAWNEAQPGTWWGPGCVPKACGELLGRSSWPQECPR